MARFDLLCNGDWVEIRGRQLWKDECNATGTLITEHMIDEYMRFAQQNIGKRDGPVY